MKKLGLVLIVLLSCVILLLPACAAKTTTTSVYEPQTWTKEPAMTINQNKTYTADMKVVMDGKVLGDVIIELFPEDAPHAVNNFVFLANHNFYNGLLFHRIIQDFMIQGGDPMGNGSGGPGYSFVDDKPITRDYVPGTLAMANSGPNTNQSQFFITLTNLSDPLNRYQLAKNYVIFGLVTSGFEFVQQIGAMKTTLGQDMHMSKPTVDAHIQSITITEK